jgi:hypothetical protein
MLYFNPPYPIIEGVSLLPDHADPLQWYYMPLAPHLTMVNDLPQIEVIKYRGTTDAGTPVNGGFLNFDCNIGIDESTLRKIASKLQNMFSLSDVPRLAPVQVVDGSVKMMLFGVESPQPQPGPGGKPAGTGTTAPAADPALPKFVTKIDQGAKPSLYGDNQAAFSVSLDAAGVTVLEKALQGVMSPIGIVYSLDFLGLRPAFSVRLHVDWDRVQKHLDESFGVDALFVSSQIEKAVDELIESRAIDLQVDTFVPEGEDTASIIADRDKAVHEVYDMITAAFFTPSVDPVKDERDGWDKAEHFAKTISGLAATHGWGGIGTFSYKKIDYTRVDKKILDVNITERTTVKRSCFPQGHLAGLVAGLDLSKFIMDVDLSDPYFQRRRVKAISRANFDEDSIQSVALRLRYAGAPQDVILDAATPSASLEWASSLKGGLMERDVTASYKVSFKAADGTQRPIALESPEEVTQLDNVEINPRELYSIVHVPIVPLSFPFDRFPQVEVHTRYLDPANGLKQEDLTLVTKDKPAPDWKVFVRDKNNDRFEYRLLFRGADNRDIEHPWAVAEDQHIMIRDPFPSKRVVDVVAAVQYNKVSQVFVDLYYEDPANGFSKQDSLAFSSTDPNPKSFSVDLRNPDARLVAYEATFLLANGDLVQVPRSYTLDRRIIVRPDMKGHRIVTLRPPKDLDFAAANLKQLTVETTYVDTKNGLSFSDLATFVSANDLAVFEFDYVDPEQSRYQYRVTGQFTNGLSKEADWQSTDRAELTISAL